MMPVQPQTPAQVPLRLTRRGRLVVLTALLVLLGGLAGLAAAPGLAATSDSSSTGGTTVVRQGDTLWSIAQRCSQGRDPFDTINEIRRLNRITDYTVHPGQRLILPR